MEKQEQEIELIDYLNVIWKRKWLILSGTSLAVIAALGVSLAMPKIYEVARTLKIGQWQGNALESREDVVDRITDYRNLTGLINELKLDMTPVKVTGLISIDSKDKRNVHYKVQAPDPQLATQIADWLAENIITAHKEIIDSEIRIAEEREGEISAAIHRNEAGIADMKAAFLNAFETGKIDAIALVLLQGGINEREQGLLDLRDQQRKLRTSTSIAPEYANTAVVVADPPRSVNPRIKLNVGLAGTLGLMMFTFLAFFLEYLENVRMRSRRE